MEDVLKEEELIRGFKLYVQCVKDFPRQAEYSLFNSLYDMGEYQASFKDVYGTGRMTVFKVEERVYILYATGNTGVLYYVIREEKGRLTLGQPNLATRTLRDQRYMSVEDVFKSLNSIISEGRQNVEGGYLLLSINRHLQNLNPDPENQVIHVQSGDEYKKIIRVVEPSIFMYQTVDKVVMFWFDIYDLISFHRIQ